MFLEHYLDILGFSYYDNLDMTFLIHSLVYLVVIFLACMFFVLANVANSFIHAFFCKSSFGGGGMLI